MIHLDDTDTALLRGDHGPAAAFAMELLVAYGEALGAPHFIDVTGAHVDGCLYHGQASLDFVRRLTELGGRVRVPTTLNVGTMDLIHPELYRGDPAIGRAGRDLMELHQALGCISTFTCAPYQTMFRPTFGQQIAWGESNAIVFANSVIGARTARYGDFTDLAAAMTGPRPLCRAACRREPPRRGPVRAPRRCRRPLERGRPRCRHRVHRRRACRRRRRGDRRPAPDDVRGFAQGARRDRGLDRIDRAVPCRRDHARGARPRGRLRRDGGAPPNIALSQRGYRPRARPSHHHRRRRAASRHRARHAALFPRRVRAADAAPRRICPRSGVDLYVNLARDTHAELEARGWRKRLEDAGFTLVVDTCTYVTAVMRELDGPVMTNSGKWAHYAPGNLGIDVAFGTLAECIASAARGRVTRLTP